MKLSLIALLLCCAACSISADVSDDAVCYTNAVSFSLTAALAQANSQLPPAAAAQGLTMVCGALSSPEDSTSGYPSSYQLPPETTTTSFDYSNDISNVTQKLSKFSVDLKSLMLSNVNNEFAFVSSVKVSMTGTNLPMVSLATYTAPETGVPSELDITTQVSSDVVLQYLTAGPVQLTITLYSNPITLNEVCALNAMGSLNTNAQMCVSVTASYSKSL